MLSGPCASAYAGVVMGLMSTLIGRSSLSRPRFSSLGKAVIACLRLGLDWDDSSDVATVLLYL